MEGRTKGSEEQARSPKKGAYISLVGVGLAERSSDLGLCLCPTPSSTTCTCTCTHSYIDTQKSFWV